MENLLTSLKIYCAEEKKTLNEITHSLAKLLGWEKHDFKDRLRATKLKKDASSGKDPGILLLKNRHYYEIVTLLHTFHNVPLKYFDFSLNEKLKKELENGRRGNAEIMELGDFSVSEETQERVAENYFNKSIKFLGHIKEELIVYDYLVRFQGEEENKKLKYIEAHDKIFHAIEKLLLNSSKGIYSYPEIKYTRFLALPRESGYKRSELSRIELAEKVLMHCSFPLFKHIYRCLVKFTDYGKNDEGMDEFERHSGFYLMDYSPRSYHFAVVDKGVYCLTERYRYDRFRNCDLDLLLIEDNEGEFKKISRTYQEEIDDMFKYEPQKLTLDDFKKAMKPIFDSYRGRSYGLYEHLDSAEIKRAEFLCNGNHDISVT